MLFRWAVGARDRVLPSCQQYMFEKRGAIALGTGRFPKGSDGHSGDWLPLSRQHLATTDACGTVC